MDSLFYQPGKFLASSSSSSLSGAERIDSDPGRFPRWLAPPAVAVVISGLAIVVFPITLLTLVGYVVLALAVAAAYDTAETVQAYEKQTLTVLGDHKGILELGLNVVPPFISKTYRFNMRTRTLDVPSQEVITEDSSPVTVDAVVYTRMMGPECASLQVDSYRRAVSPFAQTTLRAVLGDMEFDDMLARRNHINAHTRRELDESTDEWSVHTEPVKARKVKPSKDVRNAMEQRTSIERHRWAMVLETQDERCSAVEKAEDDKQLNIIHVQGEKQLQILETQGDAISTVFRARAAELMGERAIIDKGMETLANIGTSPSTIYVLPQELTSLLDRYGKGLSGSDVQQAAELESRAFSKETRELLGLDDIGEIFGKLDGVETVGISADAVDTEIEDGSVE